MLSLNDDIFYFWYLLNALIWEILGRNLSFKYTSIKRNANKEEMLLFSRSSFFLCFPHSVLAIREERKIKLLEVGTISSEKVKETEEGSINSLDKDEEKSENTIELRWILTSMNLQMKHPLWKTYVRTLMDGNYWSEKISTKGIFRFFSAFFLLLSLSFSFEALTRRNGHFLEMLLHFRFNYRTSSSRFNKFVGKT